MKTRASIPLLLCCLLSFTTFFNIQAAQSKESKSNALVKLESYFKDQVEKISRESAAKIESAEKWKASREEYKRQLLEMLGLYPLPPRSDLKAVVVGKIDSDEFSVEKIHFQSIPGLYVTANLYIPKNISTPLPTVLYLCGHAMPLKPKYYHGNKVNYQHHAIWYARNGYVCLVIDTIQLGEIPGLHHGTYREGMFWWNSRGYTPAGVETWSAVRAIDYLFTRKEVDTNRIAVTGRSGGGWYGWAAMAIDERIKVGAPVAGITDLQNHVIDGTVEGHCDCMFFINTYRWDYPIVPALIAPRPLLICNTDSDSIFPLDGVVRTHSFAKKVCSYYNAPTNLGLVITPGPHKDTQELQVPVFRWFNKFLKGVDSQVSQTTTNLFQPEQLKVFDQIPTDQINTNAHYVFVKKSEPPTLPANLEEFHKIKNNLLKLLREKSFAGWDTPENIPIQIKRVFSIKGENATLEGYDFESQPNVNLRLFAIIPSGVGTIKSVKLNVLDDKNWKIFADEATQLFKKIPDIESNPTNTTENSLSEIIQEIKKTRESVVYFAPRGIGLTDWKVDARKFVQIRRRFMLLGQTLDGMRVWDIRKATQAVRAINKFKNLPLTIRSSGNMAVNTLFAVLFEKDISRLELEDMPITLMEGPDYLNTLLFMDIPQALAMASENSKIVLTKPLRTSSSYLQALSYPRAVSEKFGWKNFELKD